MFLTEQEIEWKYRDKPTAYLAGMIGGAAFAAIFSMLCMLVLAAAKDYQNYTVHLATEKWCIEHNGEWTQPQDNRIRFCNIKEL